MLFPPIRTTGEEEVVELEESAAAEEDMTGGCLFEEKKRNFRVLGFSGSLRYFLAKL